MADSHVEEHWPHLIALGDFLDGLDGKTVTVAQQAAVTVITPEMLDAIHEALLRKQRGGSLGLNK